MFRNEMIPAKFGLPPRDFEPNPKCRCNGDVYGRAGQSNPQFPGEGRPASVPGVQRHLSEAE